MTLADLIEKATDMSSQLSTASLPLLYNGRTFDFEMTLTPVNSKNSEYVNHIRLDIKEVEYV